LSFIKDALHCFQTSKDIVLLWRADKKANAQANALRTQLVEKRKVEKETNAETWTPTK
jgi:hypothetical protein